MPEYDVIIVGSGLAGLTVSSVDVSRRNDGVGGFLELPRHEFRATRDGSVDCWGSGSRSGRNIRGVVPAPLAAGALR